MCCGAWLQQLNEGGRNRYTLNTTSRSCIVNLEKVANVNIDMRPFTEKQEGENMLPRKGNHEIALRRGAWCMSDSDYIFLMEETQLREDVCEYNIGVANTFLQQRREEVQWRVDHNLDNE